MGSYALVLAQATAGARNQITGLFNLESQVKRHVARQTRSVVDAYTVLVAGLDHESGFATWLEVTIEDCEAMIHALATWKDPSLFAVIPATAVVLGFVAKLGFAVATWVVLGGFVAYCVLFLAALYVATGRSSFRAKRELFLQPRLGGRTIYRAEDALFEALGRRKRLEYQLDRLLVLDVANWTFLVASMVVFLGAGGHFLRSGTGGVWWLRYCGALVVDAVLLQVLRVVWRRRLRAVRQERRGKM